MHAFILTMFWLNVFNAMIYIVYMVSDYPRERKSVGVGFDAVCLILTIAVTAWAAYLLWGA